MPIAPRASRGAWGRRVAAAAAGLVLVAAAAQAAISWSSAGALTTTVVDAPIAFSTGSGALNTRYLGQFALSANTTAFGGEFKAKPGADAAIRDVVRLTNHDDAPRSVTLRANQVSSAQYEVFSWTVKDGTAVIATLDYRAATPTASLTMTAGKMYTLDLRADLADGAGLHNAATSLGLWLEVG